MISILQEALKTLPTKARFAFSMIVDVDWPSSVQHEGETYFLTSKEGNRISDGMPCTSYARLNSSKYVWLNIDGEITED